MKFLKTTVFATALFAANAFAQGSPAQEAAVKEMLEALNFRQTMSQMVGAMGAQMPQMLDQMLEGNSKSLSDGERAAMKQSARESQAKMFAEMNAIFQDPAFMQSVEDIMGRAYAKHFSVEEIKGITAFYRSPAGAKMLSSQPLIVQQAMPEMMSLMAPKMNAIVEKSTKELMARAESKKQEAGAAKK
jgi:uncharacterized protein